VARASIMVQRVAASLDHAFSVPESFGTPTFIVGNPAGAGVYIWNSTANSRASVFYENASGMLRSWPVLTGAANTFQRGASGFAVIGTSVWMGINSSVIELDASSGRVRYWRIPVTRPLASKYLFRAANGQAMPAAVQGLAVAPNGDVAVAMSQSSAAELLYSRSGKWRQINMPASFDEPISVGFSSTGVLGVGFADHKTHLANGFLIYRHGNAATSAVRDAWEVTPISNGDFLVGASRPDIVGVDGVSAHLATPAALLDPTGPAEPPAYLPTNQVIFITESGVIRFPVETVHQNARIAATALSLPRVRCAVLMRSISVLPGARRPSHGRWCSVPIQLMTSDAAGDIWVLTGLRSGTISRLGVGGQ